MASEREIRRRIRAVTSMAKTTNAMQLVAASKMRRAQGRALAARPYAGQLRALLADVAAVVAGATDEGVDERALHPLLERRTGPRTLILHITPDRGLCGALHANLNRRTGQLALEHRGNVGIVAVGRKGRDFFVRLGHPLIAEFTKLGDYPEMADVLPITRLLMDEFTGGRFDRVVLVFARFVSTVTQRPEVLHLLPIEPPAGVTGGHLDFIWEPSAEAVLSELLPRYVEMQVYEAVLENAASEQSARMVAMKNATDAAKDMVDALTLEYNKARQDSITRQLLDIVGGVAGVGQG